MIVLRPSKIEGVGCFTLVPIQKAQKIELLWDGDDFRLMTGEEMARYELDPVLRQVVDRYCVPAREGWYVPKTFSRMSVGWYLNHSTSPNVEEDAERNFIALRDIEVDEELTIDYDVLVEDGRRGVKTEAR
jgi:hypothetical protein